MYVYSEKWYRSDCIVDSFVKKVSFFYYFVVTARASRVSMVMVRVSVTIRVRFSFSNRVDIGFPNMEW